MMYFDHLDECSYCHQDGRRVSKKDADKDGMIWCGDPDEAHSESTATKYGTAASHSSIPSCLREEQYKIGGMLP
jgi:hypothetical protein